VERARCFVAACTPISFTGQHNVLLFVTMVIIIMINSAINSTNVNLK
jgi:hypothetical protein